MSNTHESLKLADTLDFDWDNDYITIAAEQAAAKLRQQHALIVQMAEALSELAELVELIRSKDYTPDSFTTQPAKTALAAAKDYLK